VGTLPSPEQRHQGIRSGALLLLGAAIAAGGVAFAVAYIRDTDKTLPVKDASTTTTNADVPAAAEVVAKRFIRNAITRGTIRDASRAYRLKLDYAGPKETVVTVAFPSTEGRSSEPQVFYLTLVKVGSKGSEHWAVDAWVSRRSVRASAGG
jgi:hypothetical protein